MKRQHERIAERHSVLGAQVAEEAQSWATRAFGPVPEEPLARLECERRAGVVAGYREATVVGR
jgi:hypothetical protein